MDPDEFDNMKKRYLINYIAAEDGPVLMALEKLTKAQLLSIVRFDMKQSQRVDSIFRKESC
jgi:hypothetical protein